MKGEFLSVLIHSDTFWSETALFAIYSLCLIAFAIFLFIFLGRRIAVQKVGINHQAGAAAAVDFVLTFPIFMLVLFLTIQFALIANASLHVHYAAYSAAHSAGVFYFDTATNKARGLKYVSQGVGLFYNAKSISLANANTAEKKALDAARMSLISVGSPKKGLISSPDTTSDAWKGINTYTETLSKQQGTSKVDVFNRKASYAFDNYNLILDVGLDLNIGQALIGSITANNITQVTEWPVKANVTFKYILALPIAAKIFGIKGSHGFYFRDLHAEMSLL